MQKHQGSLRKNELPINGKKNIKPKLKLALNQADFYDIYSLNNIIDAYKNTVEDVVSNSFGEEFIFDEGMHEFSERY